MAPSAGGAFIRSLRRHFLWRFFFKGVQLEIKTRPSSFLSSIVVVDVVVAVEIVPDPFPFDAILFPYYWLWLKSEPRAGWRTSKREISIEIEKNRWSQFNSHFCFGQFSSNMCRGFWSSWSCRRFRTQLDWVFRLGCLSFFILFSMGRLLASNTVFFIGSGFLFLLRLFVFEFRRENGLVIDPHLT